MANRITNFIAKHLDLVPKEVVQENTEKLRKQLEKTIDAKIKAGGVDQEGRPRQRATFLKGQPIGPDMKIDEMLKAYKGWVYTCVSKNAGKVADIELVLKRRVKQGEFELVDTHPVLDLLFNVNPIYTSYLLYESTQAYLELTGECYWWLAGSNEKGENPKEVWVLRPDWVKLNDSNDKLIESVTYGPPGVDQKNKIKIPWEQIVPFKDFNPRNFYRGYGTTKAAAYAIDTDDFSAKYNRQFFKNSARPDGALKTDQILINEDYDRIRNHWDAVHKGSDNAWKVAILEAGLDWSDIGMNQKDMQFIEGRRFNRDEIFSAYGVPKSIAMITDDVNLAAIKEHRAIWLEETIDPKLKRFVTFLTEFLLPRYGDQELFFDYMPMNPDNDDLELREIDNGLRHGWMTRNEARDKRGLEPIDGGDTLMVPFSLADIGAEVTPADKARAIQRAINHHNVRTAPYPSDRKKMDELWQKVQSTAEKYLRAIQAEKLKALRKEAKNAEDGEIVPPTETEGDEPQVNEKREEMRNKVSKALRKRTDRREADMHKRLNALFRDQESRVLDKMASGVEKTMRDMLQKAQIDDIADLTADNELFFSPLMDYLKTIVEAEGITQIQELVADKVFYMATKEVKKYLSKEGAKFIPAVNDETSENIRRTLTEGVDAGESISKLRERVQDVYRDATTYRAERIARTEVLRASNFATEEAYRQSNVVEAKEWLTAHDERVCPWCGPMDGKTIELNDAFADKGDTITGTNENGKKVRLNIGLSDVQAPPLHPNCRCTLIPVLKED